MSSTENEFKNNLTENAPNLIKNAQNEIQVNLDPLHQVTELQIQTNFKYFSSQGIQNLKTSQKITNLNLCDMKILDIELIAQFSFLTDLNLKNNQINNLNALKNLKTLQNLNLGYNNIENIDALSGLTEIVCLNIEHNKIKRIEALKDIKMLQNFNADVNYMYNISVLANNTELNIVSLQQNNILRLDSMTQDLKQLEYINLTYNQIYDVKPLMFLCENEMSTYVLLRYNNIQNVQILDYTKAPNIQTDDQRIIDEVQFLIIDQLLTNQVFVNTDLFEKTNSQHYQFNEQAFKIIGDININQAFKPEFNKFQQFDFRIFQFLIFTPQLTIEDDCSQKQFLSFDQTMNAEILLSFNQKIQIYLGDTNLIKIIFQVCYRLLSIIPIKINQIRMRVQNIKYIK
ncbi:DUF2252_family protein [Hexamita inflata]|uniref:DUF2252 family protein n=1 Tax=Hexamita inflata TaxID=28002 RepID=A0AA86Q935_9EUKA|nr:DUF2252 family protein [Hexamita inflata]